MSGKKFLRLILIMDHLNIDVFVLVKKYLVLNFLLHLPRLKILLVSCKTRMMLHRH